MKKIINIFFLLCLFLVISCSNDENEINSNNKGYLTIGDKTVTLTQGYLENYEGSNDNVYNIDFTARSTNLYTSDTEAIVYFELFSSLEKKLEKGEYLLGNYQDKNSFTYTKWGQSLLGEGVSPFKTGVTVKEGISIRPTSGTFTVHNNSTVYHVSFTGKGTAEYYVNSELKEVVEDVSFSFEYHGSVVHYENKQFKSNENSSGLKKFRKIAL
ncbi:hypothetical protein [Wenyingzhuangia sp. IMCC45467]